MSILANCAQPLATCPVSGILPPWFLHLRRKVVQIRQKMKGYEVAALL